MIVSPFDRQLCHYSHRPRRRQPWPPTPGFPVRVQVLGVSAFPSHWRLWVAASSP